MRNFNISFVAVIIWALLCFSVMAKSNTDEEYKLPEQNTKSAYSAANIKNAVHRQQRKITVA